MTSEPPKATLEEIRHGVIKAECELDHLFFTRYFFKHRQGIKFIVNWHHHLIADAIQRVIDGHCPNLVINVAPGSSKTENAVINLIARGLAINPQARFLHITSGDDLALLNSQTARDIVQSDEYQALWPLQIADDAKAKKRWNVIVDGKKAGGVYAVSLGGQITGFRAGHMAEGFQGAIICFPHDETVLTANGPLRIGNIVDKGIDVEVYSRCPVSGAIELKNILGRHKNPGSPIVCIELSDGTSFKSTPYHRIWTTNRGWVAAIDLVSSDTTPDFEPLSCLPYCTKFKPSFFHNLGVCLSRIKKIIPFVLGTPIPSVNATPYNGDGCRNVGPCLSVLNKANRGNRRSEFLPDFFQRPRMAANRQNLTVGELGPSTLFSTSILAKSMAIAHIVSACSVIKIAESVIAFVTILVANLKSFFLRTHECLHNRLMNPALFPQAVSYSNKKKVARWIVGWNKNAALDSFGSEPGIIRNRPVKASRSPLVRHLIKPLKSRERKPTFIRYIGHEPSTYCLSVEDNHNFFIGDSQRSLLVSNCDDIIKADEAYSPAAIRAANRKLLTTVKSRKANPATPVILIMQRVGENDPTAFIKGGNFPGKWEILPIPALIDDAYVATLPEKLRPLVDSAHRDDKGRFSYWPYKEPLEDLLALEAGKGNDADGNKVSRFVFASQYQQAPTAIGGNIIKGQWFPRASPPKITYRKIYADTAQKTAERNDYTVFECWGYGEDKKIHLLDLLRGKWEAPELKRQAIDFWNKHHAVTGQGPLRELVVEDKSSGTGLIQEIKRTERIPVRGVERNNDKLTRVMDAVSFIDAGFVILPQDAPFVSDFIVECEAFTADDSHAHDDQIDPMCDAIMDMLAAKPKSFFDVT